MAKQGEIISVVYANNSPAPTASTLADLRLDAAERFSVPLDSILFTKLDGMPADYNMPITEAPPRMLVQVLQADGHLTTYETLMVMQGAGGGSGV